MKAVLRYSDCMLDGKNVFRILATHGVEILRTKHKAYSTRHTVTIRVENVAKLNELVRNLNSNCTYDVTVIKTKSEASLFERIKRIWE